MRWSARHRPATAFGSCGKVWEKKAFRQGASDTLRVLREAISGMGNCITHGSCFEAGMRPDFCKLRVTTQSLLGCISVPDLGPFRVPENMTASSGNNYSIFAVPFSGPFCGPKSMYHPILWPQKLALFLVSLLGPRIRFIWFKESGERQPEPETRNPILRS